MPDHLVFVVSARFIRIGIGQTKVDIESRTAAAFAPAREAKVLVRT